jgi:hypothetical protein
MISFSLLLKEEEQVDKVRDEPATTSTTNIEVDPHHHHWKEFE